MESPSFPQIDEKLTDEDVDAIKQLIENDDRVQHKKILWAVVKNDDLTELRTGQYFGPRCAHGNVITLANNDGAWQIIQVGFFIS